MALYYGCFIKSKSMLNSKNIYSNENWSQGHSSLHTSWNLVKHLSIKQLWFRIFLVQENLKNLLWKTTISRTTDEKQENVSKRLVMKKNPAYLSASRNDQLEMLGTYATDLWLLKNSVQKLHILLLVHKCEKEKCFQYILVT